MRLSISYRFAKTVFVLYLLSSINLYAQRYEFTLYFEDAIGNRDSIILGLDPTSTTGIDEAFEEINILSEPYQDGLDVRIVDGWLSLIESRDVSYHSKKQILPKELDILNIIIHTDYFPVTASWDQDYFLSRDSISKTFITSIHPGGWFDTGSPSNLGTVALRAKDQVTFTSNISENYNKNYLYILGDTMPTYWFTFAAEDTEIVSTNDRTIESNYKIVPNPTSGLITVDFPINNPVKSLILYNLHGQAIRQSEDETLDLSPFSRGIYFLKLVPQKGPPIIQRVVKN